MTKKWSIVLLVALFISGAANAFFIGLFIGGPLGPHGFSMPPMSPDLPFMRLEAAAKTLNEPYKTTILKELDGSRASIRASMEQTFITLVQLKKELTAATLNKESLYIAFDALDAQDQALKSDIKAMMTRIVTVLPDTERQRFFNEALPDITKNGPPQP